MMLTMMPGRLSEDQLKQAESLNEGGVLCAYYNGRVLKMETREGKNPYVWINNKWNPKFPRYSQEKYKQAVGRSKRK